MTIEFIDLLNQKTPLSLTRPNSVLPNNGKISIRKFEFDKIYVNGVAYYVTDNNCELIVNDKDMLLEFDVQKCRVNILMSDLSKDTLMEYSYFGQKFEENCINGAVDDEMLFTAIEETDAPVRLSICSFNRSIDEIKQDDNIDAISFFSHELPCVFYHPKLHLRQMNEIKPVSTVSRIGSESIKHLASHSEHWEGRKANGLIPARVLARVLEDEYAIYENVAAKSLVDNLYIMIRKKREDVDRIRMQTPSDDSSHSVSSEQKNYFQAVNVLLQGFEEGSIQLSCQLLDDQKNKLNRILSHIVECRSTNLYRKLRGSKTVRGTLKKTNIFMMDKHYKYIYKLWNIARKDVELNDTKEIPKLSNEYSLFCKTLFMFAMKYFNFNFVTDQTTVDLFLDGCIQKTRLSFMDWELQIDEYFVEGLNNYCFMAEVKMKSTYSVDMTGLTMPAEQHIENFKYISIGDIELRFSRIPSIDEIEKISKHLKDQVVKDPKKQNRFYNDLKQRLMSRFSRIQEAKRKILFVPISFKLPESSAEMTKSIDLLKSKIDKSNEFDEIYLLLPAMPNEYTEIDTTISLTKLLNYGYAERYNPAYGEKVFGTIPICIGDINSFRRFTKIVLRNMVIIDAEHTYCPICGNKIYHAADGVHRCMDCEYEMVDTCCNNCKESYTFSRYKLPKATGIEVNTAANMLLYHEIRTGFKNLTAMDEENLRPICPHCGL